MRLQVHTVEGGDHGLNVKGGKAATAEARTALIDAAVDFVKSISAQHGLQTASGQAQQSKDEDQSEQGKDAPARKRARKTH